MGKIECTINEPPVNQRETVFPRIVFAPGDSLYVNADGCVQTGGLGDTWKRYVNPSGDNSDHLYHGLVRIPTARLAGTDVGNSLTRIKNVVGRLITVTGEGSPLSDVVLHLGYEGKNFSDYSYRDHDNGTEDQCKTDTAKGHDGGPAHVTITIFRGVEPDPPRSRYDFDVLSSWVDPNGFLLNPHWSWQDKPGNHGKIPMTEMCHQFSKYDVLRRPGPNFPDCTDQAGLDSVDQPEEPNSFICDLAKEHAIFGAHPPFAGHVNWFPITVEGAARWGGLSIDDDYQFRLYSKRDKEFSLYSNDSPDDHRQYLHVEFDSDETIDHFHTEEWQKFHDAVDASESAKANLQDCNNHHQVCDAERRDQLQKDIDVPHKYFDGDETIMTGMFGYDGEHDLGKSELHPLYAMATRRRCAHPPDNCTSDAQFDPNDDVWLIFVRNSGDEGYCSSKDWHGGFEDYTFRLPWQTNMTSVDVNWVKTKFDGTDGTSPPIVTAVPPIPAIAVVPLSGVARRTAIPADGVYVTFHLGGATVPWVAGALHLKWTGPPGRPRPPRALDGAIDGITPPPHEVADLPKAKENNEVEQKLQEAVNQLSPSQRQRVVENERGIPSTPIAVHKLPTGGQVETVTAPLDSRVLTRSGGPHAPAAGPSGRASRKLARDAAQMRALCAVTDNAPKGLPPEVCKAQRPH